MSNVDPSSLGKQLIDFTKKLVLILMQIARTFKSDPKTIKAVKLFLKTIEQHQEQNTELVSCIHRILEHETFH
jgi:hypothetical protein